MRKLVTSSLAVLLAVSAYAQENKDPEVASDVTASSETAASDEVGTGSLHKNYGCSGCGSKGGKK